MIVSTCDRYSQNRAALSALRSFKASTYQLQIFAIFCNQKAGTSVNNQTGLMTFVLETSGGVQGKVQEQISSSDLISDTGGIHASVSWSPQRLVPNSNSTLRINFTDAFSGGSLNVDVMYDLIILDNNGTLVIIVRRLQREHKNN